MSRSCLGRRSLPVSQRDVLTPRHASGTVESAHIPADIYYAVIDSVAALLRDEEYQLRIGPFRWLEQHAWRSTLCACALVSKEWYFRSHYHLKKHAWLSSSKQVRELLKRLRADCGYGAMVEHVTISGALSRGVAQPIPHLGAFATMLCRHLPGVERLTMRNVIWLVGSVQPKCLTYLAAFRALTEVEILRVIFVSTSQLAQLLSGLPNIHKLTCCGVDCYQEQATLIPRVIHCERLHTLVSARTSVVILAFLAYGLAAQVKCLTVALGHHVISDDQNKDWWPCQQLLDAHISSLKYFRCILHYRPKNAETSEPFPHQ